MDNTSIPHRPDGPDPAPLLRLWGLEPGRVRHEIPLCGSPERCDQRWAVEDRHGKLWVLELLTPGRERRRRAIAETLDGLAPSFPWLAPYRATPGGDAVLSHGGRSWQLSPYIPHDPLLRPSYLDDGRMGRSLGSRLTALAQASARLDPPQETTPFSLRDFARGLVETIASREPAHAPRAQRLFEGLAPFWDQLETGPKGFCHGDCHPLNVLWKDGEVRALIDWEFCGIRPRLYDLANCLGCVGIEHPRGLVGPFAMGLLETSRESLLSGPDAPLLPELTLALRFAWLSEWFRYADEECIALELDYMELLRRQLDSLRSRWIQPPGPE